jgi:hypothetical protein
VVAAIAVAAVAVAVAAAAAIAIAAVAVRKWHTRCMPESRAAQPQPPPARRRWSRRLGLGLVLAVTVTWGVAGCTAVVTPPRDVVDGVQVYVLLDDQHRGLVLPDAEVGQVEYGFGEWWWYALREDAWHDTCRAVLWPTRSTLGRRPTHATDLVSLRQRFHWMQVHPIRVDRDKATALREELAKAYAAGHGEEVYNSLYGFHFVPHADSYWAFHNCNDKVAEWLRTLGCEISWVPICLGIEIEASAK